MISSQGNWRKWMLFALLWGLLGGCGGPDANRPEPASALRSLVDASHASLVEQRAERLAAQERNALEEALRARVSESPSDQAVLAFYSRREFAPLFIGAEWTEANEEMVRFFGGIEDHAIDLDVPDVALWLELRRRLGPLYEGIEQLEARELSAKERATIVDLLEDEDFDAAAAKSQQRLVARLDSPNSSNPSVALQHRTLTSNYLARQATALRAEAEAEMALTFGRIASALRLAHPENTARVGLWRDDMSLESIESARVKALFRFAEERGVAAAIASLIPPHPGYLPLVEARGRYREIAEMGGWESIELGDKKSRKRLRNLRFGKAHPIVSEIRNRLAVEGYATLVDDPDAADVYDRELAKEIELYQETHQLKADGEIDEALIRNLNLSVADRLAKIDVTLRRYHRSLVGSMPQYVFVNIPDFYAEVWRYGERAMRFRIVVGNNTRKRNPKTRKIFFPNRTPLQFAWLKRVIYNPYWNVPPRIRTEELEPHLLENPFWYEENGYEVMYPDEPRRSYVRQLPGKRNALGRVKFIFPNPHDTYLHDTPSKALFRKPVRAFSHGCMRVKDPLDFAEHLLREDGQWDDSWIHDILHADPLEETWIRLRRYLAVHVDYFNTRVDDSGHVAFLSDVYDYDKADIEARTQELIERYKLDGE